MFQSYMIVPRSLSVKAEVNFCEFFYSVLFELQCTFYNLS